MTLKPNEQPLRIKGSNTESAANTFTAVEVTVPRILATREFYDADQIRLKGQHPLRTTTGLAFVQAQLIISDDTPTAFLAGDDPKMLCELNLEGVFGTVESAAGVFTIEKLAPTKALEGCEGFVDSTRWRNILPDDKVWIIQQGSGNSAAKTVELIMLGKMEKLTQDDYNNIIMSRL